MNVRSINYHNRIFRTLSNSNNGETSAETEFHYKHIGNIVFADYSGGAIQYGHLLGIVSEYGTIDMRYHQVNALGEIMTGKCISTPEILPDGRIRLYEVWEWTSGDKSKGTSIIEEQ